jgi:hypothetical protein
MTASNVISLCLYRRERAIEAARLRAPAAPRIRVGDRVEIRDSSRFRGRVGLVVETMAGATGDTAMCIVQLDGLRLVKRADQLGLAGTPWGAA